MNLRQEVERLQRELAHAEELWRQKGRNSLGLRNLDGDRRATGKGTGPAYRWEA